MTPDPRWLEILKASGWQTTAIAAACGVFLLIAAWGWLPPLPAIVTLAVVFTFLVCTFLALASMGSALFQFIPLKVWILHYVYRRREERAIREYIPHMTEEEREIVAYLLAKNQKSFTGAMDGGRAATLISRRIIVRALQPQQVFLADDVPFMIPDHVWTVLHHHRERFPYTPKDDVEAHPWREHWMAR